MTRVAILGATGMLGSMVRHWLSQNGSLEVISVDRSRLDAERFIMNPDLSMLAGTDYIINCIGIIKPYCKDNDPAGVRRAINTNALFPHVLAHSAQAINARVIQIATDCVYSGQNGGYLEKSMHDALDVYGKSKSLGEVCADNTLHVRCSIIGPEIKRVNRVPSLLEWFLGRPDGSSADGYTHHLWNGVTTLQFAQLCEKLVVTPNAFQNGRQVSHVQHFVPNEAVSKYELLRLIAEYFQKDVLISEVSDAGPPVDRTLATEFNFLESLFGSQSMKTAISELYSETQAYRAHETTLASA